MSTGDRTYTEGDFVMSRYGHGVTHIWIADNGHGVATMSCGVTLFAKHLLYGDGDDPKACVECWDLM